MDVITNPTDEYLRTTFPLGPVAFDADLQAQLHGLMHTVNWFHESLSQPLAKAENGKGTLGWMVHQRMAEANETAEPGQSISFSVEDFARLGASLTPEEWNIANLSLWSNRTHDAIINEFKERADKSGDPGFNMLVMMLQQAPSSLSLAMAVATTTRAMHAVVVQSFMRKHPELRIDFGHHVLWTINSDTKSVDITGYRSDLDRQKAELSEAEAFGGGKPSAN